MNKIYYKKNRVFSVKKVLRVISLLLCCGGIGVIAYVLFPFMSWQIYFAPVFANQAITAPIPKKTIVTPLLLESLFSQAQNNLSINYSDAKNWFPSIHQANAKQKTALVSYRLSIPKLGIKNAYVSTVDYDLDNHLINYGGTALPPNKGTAVIFGHSTLPQLFNNNDYKTIFARLYTIKNGDAIQTTVGDITYTYKVYNTTVTDPLDTSVFAQQYDAGYLTLVTCTPPGTTWKRLIVRARMEESLE